MPAELVLLLGLAVSAVGGDASSVNALTPSAPAFVDCGNLDKLSCELWSHLCSLMPGKECGERKAPCSKTGESRKADMDWTPRAGGGGGGPSKNPCDDAGFGWWAGEMALNEEGVCCAFNAKEKTQSFETLLLPTFFFPGAGAQEGGVPLNGILNWTLLAAQPKLRVIDFGRQPGLQGSLPRTQSEYPKQLEALRISGATSPTFTRGLLKGPIPAFLFNVESPMKSIDFSFTSLSGHAPQTLPRAVRECSGFPSSSGGGPGGGGPGGDTGGEPTCCDLRGTLLDCATDDALAFCRLGEVSTATSQPDPHGPHGGIVVTNKTLPKCVNGTTEKYLPQCLAELEVLCGKQKATHGQHQCEVCISALNPGPADCASPDLTTKAKWCTLEHPHRNGLRNGLDLPTGPDCKVGSRVFDYYWWCSTAIAPTFAPTPGGPTLPPAANIPGILPPGWNPANTPASLVLIVIVTGALATLGMFIGATIAVRRMRSRAEPGSLCFAGRGGRRDSGRRGTPLLDYADDDDEHVSTMSNDDLKSKLGDLLIPASQVEVGRKIAAGGMGEVRIGRLGGEAVVLKATFDQLVHGEEETFWHEAKMLERIRHPRVVHFYGVTQVPMRTMAGRLDEGRMRFFLVMEYLERGSIVDNVKRGQYDLVESFMDHAKQLASTVAWLHLRGIVHRDIKPGNVLLDASGGIKLCDLGVSRYLPGSATELFGQASNATASQRETYGSATMTINIGTVKCVPSFSSSSSSSSSSPILPLFSSPRSSSPRSSTLAFSRQHFRYMPPELLSFGFGDEAPPDLQFASTAASPASALPASPLHHSTFDATAAAAAAATPAAEADLEVASSSDPQDGVGCDSQDLRQLISSHGSQTYPPYVPDAQGVARYDGKAWDVYAMGACAVLGFLFFVRSTSYKCCCSFLSFSLLLSHNMPFNSRLQVWC